MVSGYTADYELTDPLAASEDIVNAKEAWRGVGFNRGYWTRYTWTHRSTHTYSLQVHCYRWGMPPGEPSRGCKNHPGCQSTSTMGKTQTAFENVRANDRLRYWVPNGRWGWPGGLFWTNQKPRRWCLCALEYSTQFSHIPTPLPMY